MALPRYITVHDVAEMLSISYDSALRLVHDAGGIKVRPGLVRISEDALASYLRRCPGAKQAHESTDALAARVCSPRSAETSDTSRLEPTTTRKPVSRSQISSSVERLKLLRRSKAS